MSAKEGKIAYNCAFTTEETSRIPIAGKHLKIA